MVGRAATNAVGRGRWPGGSTCFVRAQASSLAPGATSGDLVTTTTTYDDLGNPLTVTAPGNNADASIVTTYEYETDGTYSQPAAVGQPLYVEDNLGHRTHFRYDGRGNRTLVTDALGQTWVSRNSRRTAPPRTVLAMLTAKKQSRRHASRTAGIAACDCFARDGLAMTGRWGW